jgi:hypothetical protein
MSGPRLIGRLIAVAAVAAVVVFAADRALGALGYPSEPPLPVAYAPHTTVEKNHLEFRYTVRTNRHGIRYPDIDPEAAPGERRVVVVGDSFTEGMGVDFESTFTAQLERIYSASGDRVRFINCGIVGANPAKYARLFREVGLAYGPDAALVVIYPNDVIDTTPRTDEELRTGEGWLYPRTTVKNPKRGGVKTLVHGFAPRVYTLAVMAKRNAEERRKPDLIANAVAEARRRGISEERIEAWRAKLDMSLVEASNRRQFDGYMLSEALLSPDYWLQSLDIRGDEAERKWRTMRAILGRIVELARDEGVPIAFVYAPAPFQYDAAYKSPSEAAGMTFRREWLTKESELERRLARFVSEKDVPFLNLTPHFRRAAAERPGRMQYRLDPHWTPEGNRLAAETLGAWLAAENLVPGER